jgi:hypothetical protein
MDFLNSFLEGSNRRGAQILRDSTVPLWHLDTEITFGEYRGCTVREVLNIRAEYVKWAVGAKMCKLGEDVLNYILEDSHGKENKEEYKELFFNH